MTNQSNRKRRINPHRLPWAMFYIIFYPVFALGHYFKNRRRIGKRLLPTLGRALYTVLLQIICIALASIILIYHGPFVKIRDSIVIMAMDTHEQKYWATWFLSTEEINAIMDKANPKLLTAEQDVSAIKVNALSSTSVRASSAVPGDSSSSPGQVFSSADLQGVTITDVSGNKYRGKLMTIDDPSRVTISLSPKLGHSGSRLSQIVTADKAIGGVNAGGFLDDNFIQNGALPSGIVIVDGAIKWQQKGLKHFDIIGFNKDNVLVISNSMTLSQIKRSNLRCAVSFGPSLIINGKSLVVSGGTGLEPRTAIGQRKDGTVLLLVIDGRQSSSSGITYKTLADLMLQYGAYNAANLDGGSSTTMYWDNKIINSPCDILGERSIPTAFVVMPKS